MFPFYDVRIQPTHLDVQSLTIVPALQCFLVDIENDLSTFSAHIQNLAAIVDNAHEHSLILLDELGTGTDPESSGPWVKCHTAGGAGARKREIPQNPFEQEKADLAISGISCTKHLQSIHDRSCF